MPKELDMNLLADVLARFEAGQDLTPGNPFDPDSDNMNDFLINMVYAYVEGNAVPETEEYLGMNALDLPEDATEDERNQRLLTLSFVSMAQAGFLQGLVAGYEYAARESHEAA